MKGEEQSAATFPTPDTLFSDFPQIKDENLTEYGNITIESLESEDESEVGCFWELIKDKIQLL